MRLDKYLKTSLIFKTRSSAEKAIKDGQVFLNEKNAKSSNDIKTGDIIRIIYPLKEITYIVENVFEKNVTKSQAKEMYQIKEEIKYEI